MIIITKDYTLRASILTLGCKVNQYESEVIMERLEDHGYIPVDTKSLCDVFIINTCAVTGESSRKSYQMIRRAVKSNPNAVIAVTGCNSQLDLRAVENIKGVDIICGNYHKLAIVEAIAGTVSKRGSPLILRETFIPDDNFELMSAERFNRTRAYIKIQDGCDNNCSYCVIPKIRGNIRMKSFTDVIREACNHVRNGCKEIVLIGIETSSYHNLPGLISELQKIDGLERIRLGSLDPSYMRQSVADEIMANDKVTPHFHLSMQSGCDKILRSMRRKYNTSIAERNIEYIRSLRGDVNFTTDIMVGYPDETESDFNETVDFIKRIGFLHVHIFTYSKRPGTVAADLPNQIPEPVKIQRAAVLSKIQTDIKRSIYQKYIDIGEPLSVLVETYNDNNLIAVGHTPNFLEVEITTNINKDIKDKIINVIPIKVNESRDILIGEEVN